MLGSDDWSVFIRCHKSITAACGIPDMSVNEVDFVFFDNFFQLKIMLWIVLTFYF